MVIITCIFLFLEVLQYIMLASAILSWLPDFQGTKMAEFLDSITEPIVAPIRKLISRTRLAEFPFDLSFLIAYVILQTVTSTINSMYHIM